MPDRPLRVVLADDDTEFLQSLATALAAYDWIDVVGIAGDGGEAERLYAGLAPDVLVMDLLMAGSNGVEATRRIVRADPDAHVVILTASSDERALTLCMRAGARACLRKDPLTPRMLPLMLTLTRLQALPAARERKPGKDDARATAPDTGRSRAVTSHVKMRLLGLACVTLAVGLAGCGDDVMSGEAAVARIVEA